VPRGEVLRRRTLVLVVTDLSVVKVVREVQAGQGADVIDHGIYLNDALAERMVRQGTYYSPTLSAYCCQTM
jgi:imidazolonepropionase-like amidohydrolase